ncbi:MAG: metal-sensitive transcriptional regulator [Actinomycetota bacterium]
MSEPHGSYAHQKKKLMDRLGRIEGQIKDISRMIDDEKYCIDVLTQISAVRAALDKVALVVLEDHVHGCIQGAVTSTEGKAKIDELLEVMERFVALRR